MAALATCAAISAPSALSSSTFVRSSSAAKLHQVFPIRRGYQRSRVQQPRAYQVTFDTPSGTSSVEIPEDQFILDAAEEAGLDLPYSCRSGTCSSCAAKIVGEGEVDQSEQQMLDEDKISRGFVLICSAYAKSDLQLKTHQEEEIY